jgi:phosphohistidine swiveling domain-containing protein
VQANVVQAVDLAVGEEPDEIVFAKNELSEMLPRPTPLSLSLMEALWAGGGSVDLAARQLGLSYNPDESKKLLVPILGRLYVDRREERARAIAITGLTARRLLRSGDRIEREFRDEFLPMYLDEARPQSVADFDKLETQDLLREVARIRDRFVFDTHVAVDVVNIAASFYLDRARRSLAEKGMEPSSVLGSIPQTVESQAIAGVSAALPKSRPWLLARHFGHRAVLDYELAEPRFAEDAALLNRTFIARERSVQARQDNAPALPDKSLDRVVNLARRFQTLKEDAKHHTLRDLAALRRAVLAVDRRFEMNGDIFYLSFDELLALNDDNAAEYRAIANERHDETRRLRSAESLPSTLTAHDLEAVSAGELSELHAMPEVIRGTRVSGSKAVEGRARVISEDDAEHGAEIEGFRDGDIIVAAMVNPAWLPYFSRAGGFVSEVGGWLSHPAILAREFDVAMVVGTDGIGRIEDGSLLRLSLDGRVEVIGSSRAAAAA